MTGDEADTIRVALRFALRNTLGGFRDFAASFASATPEALQYSFRNDGSSGSERRRITRCLSIQRPT
jgi:hypothetical protein